MLTIQTLKEIIHKTYQNTLIHVNRKMSELWPKSEQQVCSDLEQIRNVFFIALLLA